MHFEEWMELIVRGFEALGVAILVVGTVFALARAAVALRRGERSTAYSGARQGVGRGRAYDRDQLPG